MVFWVLRYKESSRATGVDGAETVNRGHDKATDNVFGLLGDDR
jgi:hypothetical protein